MPLQPLSSLRGFLAGILTLGVFAALPCHSQTSTSATAPTVSEDPTVIDQAWQKASAKYDAPRAAILNDVDRVAHQGPFRPDWESLQKYQAPDWYKDAKFGIFIHWGVYSVPAFGNEWYPRNMYRERFGRVRASHRHLRYAGQIRLQGFHPHVQSRTLRSCRLGPPVQGVRREVRGPRG